MLSKFSRANVPLRFTVLIPATQVVPPLGGSYGNTDMWLVRWHMLLRTDPLEYRIPFYFLCQSLLSWRPWSEKLSSPPCSRCLISGQYSEQTKAWFFFSLLSTFSITTESTEQGRVLWKAFSLSRKEPRGIIGFILITSPKAGRRRPKLSLAWRRGTEDTQAFVSVFFRIVSEHSQNHSLVLLRSCLLHQDRKVPSSWAKINRSLSCFDQVLWPMNETNS